MKKVIITKDRYDFTTDTGIMYYYCPECESDNIERGFNYCPNCGSKITWRLK